MSYTACCYPKCEASTEYEVEITHTPKNGSHSTYWYFCQKHWDLARVDLAIGTADESFERWSTGRQFPKVQVGGYEE